MIELVRALLFVAPCVLGIAAASLMVFFFDVAIRRLPARELLQNLVKIAAWFLGNTPLVIPVLFCVDVNRSLAVEWATAAVLFSYLFGFGATTSILTLRREPALVRNLRKRMSDNEIDALLMVLAFDKEPAQAATALSVSAKEFREALKGALAKLNRRKKRIMEAIGSMQEQ